MKTAALNLLKSYPKHPTSTYAYGTAGFRFEIDETFASSVFVRAGMIAYARALVLNKTVGLCITASHNAVKDNGVKLIDPDGGMLAESWESIAAKVANAKTPEDCLSLIFELCGGEEGLMIKKNAKVYLARDTRPHSERLEKCAIQGIEALGGTAISFGIATTPQLHFCVMQVNGFGYCREYEPTLKGYERCLTTSYKNMVEGTKPLENEIFVDCANGVGATMFPSILEQVKSFGFSGTLFNIDVSDFNSLNDNCGAEHVQKTQTKPKGMPENKHRYASFDGDADRIVFYSFTEPDTKFRLLDGDKIACLMTLFVKEQIEHLNVEVSIGTVQTAYANGSSSSFLKNNLKVEAPLVKTGVKHLHHKALDYDIGIYFEANGHGTTIFKPLFVQKIREMGGLNEKGKLAQKRLIAFAELINQATGDAISDLLAVDAILRVMDMNDDTWDSLYKDLPSRQLKVKVMDRSVVETTADETRCIRPESLQKRLDDAVKTIPNGRAFVRPSGTEDVVRVYAEADTQQHADDLAEEASKAILDLAGGISDAKRVKT